VPDRPKAGGLEARPADDFTNLVYHTLSHLRVTGPSNLHDPRYLAWCRTALADETWRTVAEDSEAISSRYVRDPLATRLHAFPALHGSIDSFLRTTRMLAAELCPTDVDDVAVLHDILEVDSAMLELLRTDMALCASAYRKAFRDLVEPILRAACHEISPWLHRAGDLLPGVRERRVEIVFALGASGRALADRLFVGCRASWNNLPPAWPAVVALHEHAVQTSKLSVADARQRYVRSEWAALVHVAYAMKRADDGLREMHTAWLRTLHLEPLLADAVALRLVSAKVAQDLVSLGDERQSLLMSLEASCDTGGAPPHG
jgi:hypothetical protein